MYQSLPISNSSTSTGSVSLTNHGGFRVRFSVTYYLNGIAHTSYSGAFPIGVTQKVSFPGNAVDITAIVQLDMFIETWFLLDYKYFPTAGDYCLLAYGATIDPTLVQIPCDSLDSNGGSSNNSCCCNSCTPCTPCNCCNSCTSCSSCSPCTSCSCSTIG